MNKRISKLANDLSATRVKAERLERELQGALSAHLVEQPGGLRDLAKQLGITPAYLCDIRYGRRNISDQLLERLRALGK